MANNGWNIILGLLEAYAELKKVGATLRTISPRNICLSPDCEELLLLGIQNVTWHGVMSLSTPTLCMPYSNHNLIGYDCCQEWAMEKDLFSLGVVVLEVLVGSEMIEPINDEDQLV